MENFTNETLDINQLPRYETVQFTALHPSYWRIVLLQLLIVLCLILAVIAYVALMQTELIPYMGFLTGTWVLGVFLARISFKKKAFAFREHDVLYRSGVIATNTIVIPYNRIQHVALHEGVFSRMFGLAKIEIFTAGGNSGDIEIPGIEKIQAENIKQLLMGKIQKELS
ncbi:MAG: PH domain-containing protein [Flavobacteriaceae bacterium]